MAAHINKAIDAVGTYQRAGKVADFWPYFRACIDRYVGSNAEEIHAEAMRAGAHINQLLVGLGMAKAKQSASMTELIGQRAQEISQAKAVLTLRQKQSLARKKEAACKADASQPQLPLSSR